MSKASVTGPMAIIKVNGIAIGKIKNIRVSETYNRAEVKGLGELQVKEVPIIGHVGTFSVDSFLVDFKSDGIKGLINREVTSPEQFFNTLMFDNNGKGVDIYIYKKIPKAIGTTGLVESIEEQPIAILRRCFLDNTSFDVAEGQIGGTSQSGKFLDPIIYVS